MKDEVYHLSICDLLPSLLGVSTMTVTNTPMLDTGWSVHTSGHVVFGYKKLELGNHWREWMELELQYIGAETE